MEDFTWERIALLFPEFLERFSDGLELLMEKFENSPVYSDHMINFMENGYKFQIFLKDEIPGWIRNREDIDLDKIHEAYRELSEEVYQELSKELKENMETFESWRKFVNKFDGKEARWVGNLSDHLDFNKRGSTIRLCDYWKDESGYHPTEKILSIPFTKLPENFLNKSAHEYLAVSENIERGERTVNSITGQTLTECIQNADRIYKLAPGLEELEISK